MNIKTLTADELLVAVPSDLLKEGLLYAVAHGWRPAVLSTDEATAEAKETIPAPTPEWCARREQVRLDVIRERERARLIARCGTRGL